MISQKQASRQRSPSIPAQPAGRPSRVNSPPPPPPTPKMGATAPATTRGKGDVMTCGADKVWCSRPASRFPSTGKDGDGAATAVTAIIIIISASFLFAGTTSFFAGTLFHFCCKLREGWCRSRHDFLLHQILLELAFIFATTVFEICWNQPLCLLQTGLLLLSPSLDFCWNQPFFFCYNRLSVLLELAHFFATNHVGLVLEPTYFCYHHPFVLLEPA